MNQLKNPHDTITKWTAKTKSTTRKLLPPVQLCANFLQTHLHMQSFLCKTSTNVMRSFFTNRRINVARASDKLDHITLQNMSGCFIFTNVHKCRRSHVHTCAAWLFASHLQCLWRIGKVIRPTLPLQNWGEGRVVVLHETHRKCVGECQHNM